MLTMANSIHYGIYSYSPFKKTARKSSSLDVRILLEVGIAKFQAPKVGDLFMLPKKMLLDPFFADALTFNLLSLGMES